MAEATSHCNEMTVDRIFDVLSDERRRAVLTHLLEQPSPVAVEELVERVVSAEASGQAGRSPDAVRVSLYHNHLPKLANANAIRFDSERGLVTVREAARDFEPYLELANDGDRRG